VLLCGDCSDYRMFSVLLSGMRVGQIIGGVVCCSVVGDWSDYKGCSVLLSGGDWSDYRRCSVLLSGV